MYFLSVMWIQIWLVTYSDAMSSTKVLAMYNHQNEML